jgi:hypothetical protein
LGRAIRDHEAVIFDPRITSDLEQFEYTRDGDELIWTGISGHGDLGMACAIAWYGTKQRRQAAIRSREMEVKKQSMGPEAEPEWIAAQKSRDIWSTRFR